MAMENFGYYKCDSTPSGSAWCERREVLQVEEIPVPRLPNVYRSVEIHLGHKAATIWKTVNGPRIGVVKPR